MGKRRLSKPAIPVNKSNHSRYVWAAAIVTCFAALLIGYFRYRSDHQLLIAAVPESNLNVGDLMRYNNITIVDTSKHFKGHTLGFVTPWNDKGYQFARKFAKKFTMISPVWYQVAPGNVLTGSHHVDEPWLENLRQNNVEIVPRFNVEGWQGQDVFNLLQDPDHFADVIVKEVKQRRYDGVVLEATQAMLIADYISNRFTEIHIPSFAESVIAKLGTALNSLHKKLIIVASPDENISKSEAMVAYSRYISHIVVMTYDYNNAGQVGTLAPYNWVLQTINRILNLTGIKPGQVLLGLNFYGLDHVGHVNSLITQSLPIVANEYIQLLSNPTNKIQSVSFLETEKEHLLSYIDDKGQKHSVFYPTPKSIHERVSLAQTLGVGIQVWEIGQGFECFFDLL